MGDTSEVTEKMSSWKDKYKGLVHYLTHNYNDDTWDSTTREMLAEAYEELFGEKIIWYIEGEE